MSELENARAQKEALEAAPKVMTSADRARLWAGLNRYLESEAAHAHKAAEQERKKAEEKEQREQQEH
jgi:hypothetical protein